MARSIFNGSLRISDQAIPVKLHSAVEPRPVSFRLLHESDRVPIRQRMIHPQTGEEISNTQVHKALPLPGGMVELRDEELESLEPPASRELTLIRLIAPDRLNHQWYLRPYYLGPGKVGPAKSEADYFAFARALAAENKAGIVRWTMRKKTYRGVLESVVDYLTLITLRSPNEVVSTGALPELNWPAPSDQELMMAKQLVGMLGGELDLDQFHDRYAEQVVALAAAKAEGRPVELPTAKPQPAGPASLGDALAASIAALEERDVA